MDVLPAPNDGDVLIGLSSGSGEVGRDDVGGVAVEAGERHAS
jgi:hypothetical protein